MAEEVEIYGTTILEDDLTEWHAVRKQQDIAYEESLMADQLKVNS